MPGKQVKWTETYVKFLKAGQERVLEPKELKTLALAAYLTGKDTESFQVLEQAHQGYLEQEKTEKAVRCAFWLGMMLMNAGEKARASGWMARGERLLIDRQAPDCAEKGLFLIPTALGALSAGNAVKARQLFEQAATIGEQFNDADLTALGRLGNGQAMIQLGEMTRGIKLLDETMITVETEEVFPIVTGIVYCAVIETCRKIWDLGRAQEWTSALTRWCNAQPDIVPFRGQCLVRRTEIMQFHGEWHEALNEIEYACELLRSCAGSASMRTSCTVRLSSLPR
jgi:hypothetical protein